ncbi:unnamed protein product [Discula destructiva]
MVQWNGGNATRADQQPLTWLGCKGRSYIQQTKEERIFHERFGQDGPTRQQLFEVYGLPNGYDEGQHGELLKEMELMRYTKDGEGCRLLKRLEPNLRSSYLRPGTDRLARGAAKNALEAAEATRFYPDMPYKVMHTVMHVSEYFPTAKVKRGTAAGLEEIALVPELLKLILNYLPHTSRASLFRVSATMAQGISDAHVVWTINDENLLNSDLTLEEFNTVVKAGGTEEDQPEADDAPRGANVLTVAMTAGNSHNTRTGLRNRGDWVNIGFGVLRLCRALDNWGEHVRNLCLKHVPLVDHKVVAGLIESCPKLRKLEVIGCGQLSLYHIVKLLGHIEQIQKSRGSYIYFDPAPAYYKGPKYADFVSGDGSESTSDRRGMWGVTNNDPGVQLSVAIMKVIAYDLGPAAKAARQMHILTDMTSMCRQWLEALPLVKDAVPLMLRAWEFKEEMDALVAAAERVWNNANAGQTPIPPFKFQDWPQELREKTSELTCPFLWLAVRACFGNNGFRQTADRGFYSCNFKLTARGYKEFACHLICSECNLSLPRIFFNACEMCEGCRLQDAIDEQDDNLERLIRRATRALGYGASMKPYVANVDSNFPYDALKPVAGVSPVQSRADFVHIMIATPKLQSFIRHIQALDEQEKKAGYPRGHIIVRQEPHRWAENAELHDSADIILLRHPYRRTLTHEEQATANGEGWASWHGVQGYMW